MQRTRTKLVALAVLTVVVIGVVVGAAQAGNAGGPRESSAGPAASANSNVATDWNRTMIGALETSHTPAAAGDAGRGDRPGVGLRRAERNRATVHADPRSARRSARRLSRRGRRGRRVRGARRAFPRLRRRPSTCSCRRHSRRSPTTPTTSRSPGAWHGERASPTRSSPGARPTASPPCSRPTSRPDYPGAGRRRRRSSARRPSGSSRR